MTPGGSHTDPYSNFSHGCRSGSRFTNLSPIESLLQYFFATPKPLKARPGPGCCKTAPLYNPSRWGFPFRSGFSLVDFVHRVSRSYYLFFNYLSYYLYGEGLYAEDQRSGEGLYAGEHPIW